MIDLEATSWQPALVDIVQLVDDYPVFYADEEGWEARILLAQHYWNKTFGTDPQREVLDSAYTAQAIYRCIFGVMLCSKKLRYDDLSSSLRAFELRMRHFRALLGFMAAKAANQSARALAKMLDEETAYKKPSNVQLPPEILLDTERLIPI